MGDFSATIPLAARAQLTTAAIRADLKVGNWLNLPVPITVESAANAISFKIGDSLVTLTLARTPLIMAHLKDPAGINWTLGTAVAHVPDHVGHLDIKIVSDLAPIEQARILTRVCSSVLATCHQASGIVWTSAALFIPRSVFQDKARDLMPTTMPMDLWVNISVGTNDSGKTCGLTRGLKALGFMDVETNDADETPEKLRERLSGLALYMLENDVMQQEGDNLGVDAKERIVVKYAASSFGLSGKVMRLEYGLPPAAKKGWFKKV